MKTPNILKLKINNFLDKTENGMLKLEGVNLSVADCDSLLLYIEAKEQNNLSRYMKPLGGIAKVLKIYEVI